jgi:hypothetical protein
LIRYHHSFMGHHNHNYAIFASFHYGTCLELHTHDG